MASFINQTKHSTSFSDGSKNVTSTSNQTKHSTSFSDGSKNAATWLQNAMASAIYLWAATTLPWSLSAPWLTFQWTNTNES